MEEKYKVEPNKAFNLFLGSVFDGDAEISDLLKRTSVRREKTDGNNYATVLHGNVSSLLLASFMILTSIDDIMDSPAAISRALSWAEMIFKEEQERLEK